jgi:hypothetical protein
MRHPLQSATVVFLAVALLFGCKPARKSASPEATSLADRVIAATEQSIRVGAPPQMRFRGVQVYAQAMPQKMAVCGQLNPFSDDPDIFVPFVSIVTLPDDKAPSYQFDHRLGLNPAEASRVYVALVNYCYDKGGPLPGGAAPPPPPLPDRIPDPSARARGPQGGLVVSAPSAAQSPNAAPGASPPGASVGEVPAAGDVVVRQSANVHSDPHGPSIRVAQQGTTLHVFGQAPGGWYQVGDTAPWGWIHESMLDRK